MRKNDMINFAEVIEESNRTSFNVHDHLKNLTVPELRQVCDQQRNPFAVCLLSVTGDLNLGVIIRSASLLGAEEVVILGRRKYDIRSNCGAQNYITVSKVGGLMDDLRLDPAVFIQEIRARNYLPIFVELGGETLGKFSWKENLTRVAERYANASGFAKPCLIMGQEGGGPEGGIPPNILATMPEFPGSFRVSIPMRGVIRSYNVSSAASITMWDLCRSMDWL
jgi:tRNA G18 (ribose-2'-O)-methylase SpoU